MPNGSNQNDKNFSEMVTMPPDFTSQAKPIPEPTSPADIATDRLIGNTTEAAKRLQLLAGSQH
ncbi:MAG: hypothetical protein AUK16_01445 [Parcubacteria group bacterium CG2_30_44_11]|nr:MAG: hypothetical protein AUK16_01445 [Parcubacteria group bacterium CG2_30_44_11]